MVRIILIITIITTIGFSNPIAIATSLIKHHEGYSRHLYYDKSGELTIGYGTHLKYGLTELEAAYILKSRIIILHNKLKKYKWFKKLTARRQAVIIDMSFNLGLTGLLKFHSLIWCIKHNFYHGAANSMKKTLWYKQVGRRGPNLYDLMWKG